MCTMLDIECLTSHTTLGGAAKENGLIDEIGNINDAKNWLREQFGIEPETCVY